jgi:hypothetical protein
MILSTGLLLTWDARVDHPNSLLLLAFEGRIQPQQRHFRNASRHESLNLVR